MKDQHDAGALFAFFNEIGIIEQLARTLLERGLPKGLIASHFQVVNHLVRVRDGRTPLELARAFQLPKTTMTHTLAGLDRHQLVETRPNPRDKRSKQIWLTDAGRVFRENAIAALSPEFAKLAAAVPVDDINATLPLLRAVREYLDADRNPPDQAD